jgi:hypothetical protein
MSSRCLRLDGAQKRHRQGCELMLPDYGKIKARVQREFMKWAQSQIPVASPLLKGIAKFRQHEGRIGRLRRVDQSESTIDYGRSESEFVLTREEMRTFNVAAIQKKLMRVAEDFGNDQTKRLLEVATQAANEAGNVVNGLGEELSPNKVFELLRRVQMEFDPVTLQPNPGMSFVMHPDMAARIQPKIAAWEQDPEFNAEHQRIIDQKREEWRAREARRKLVD